MLLTGLGTLQGLVLFVLGVLGLACEVFALVDALRHRPDAFTAAGKLTKQKWTIILAVATALGFVNFISNPLGFLAIIAFVAAAVYLVDVRPALQRVSGRGQGNQSGPYGPW